jgi:phosphatidate phosphatase APP1
MSAYDCLPCGASASVKPFTAHTSQDKVDQLRSLVKIAPIAPVTYENTKGNTDRAWGTPRSWLLDAQAQWSSTFDWRERENYINSFPNFMVSVTDEVGGKFNVHFLALLSKRDDAIPIMCIHGWPGSMTVR